MSLKMSLEYASIYVNTVKNGKNPRLCIFTVFGLFYAYL